MKNYMQINKGCISYKFSYTKGNIGQEIKFSKPNYLLNWSKDDDIPVNVQKMIGPENTKSVREFINQNKI